jgi:hypothetical protein
MSTLPTASPYHSYHKLIKIIIPTMLTAINIIIPAMLTLTNIIIPTMLTLINIIIVNDSPQPSARQLIARHGGAAIGRRDTISNNDTVTTHHSRLHAS